MEQNNQINIIQSSALFKEAELTFCTESKEDHCPNNKENKEGFIERLIHLKQLKLAFSTKYYAKLTELFLNITYDQQSDTGKKSQWFL